MKTVLITGAHGFIGRYAARHFSANGCRVIGIGHGHWGFDDPVDYGIDQWMEADIDFANLADIKGRIDYIVHCAGGSSVAYSCKYPLQDFARTVDGTAKVLEYMRLHQGDAKLIYPSSAAVYGKKDNKCIRITEPLGPLSPYGFHKKMVEDLCMSYASTYGISVAIIRFFSIYGPGLQKQLLWDASNKFRKSDGRAIEFFGTGDETRDWLHVEDAASLIYCMAQSQNHADLVNGGYGQAVTVKEILAKLASLFRGNICVEFNGQSREGDPKHYWADTSEAKLLGWRPTILLEQGLNEYVTWFKEHEHRLFASSAYAR